MNKRRGFLKGFGLISTIAAGAATGYAATKGVLSVANVDVSAVKEDISHLAPKSRNTNLLVLHGDNRPPEPPKQICSSNESNYIFSGFNQCPDNELNKVAMSVGKDDRLWIRVGDSWKRVVVEG